METWILNELIFGEFKIKNKISKTDTLSWFCGINLELSHVYTHLYIMLYIN